MVDKKKIRKNSNQKLAKKEKKPKKTSEKKPASEKVLITNSKLPVPSGSQTQPDKADIRPSKLLEKSGKRSAQSRRKRRSSKGRK